MSEMKVIEERLLAELTSTDPQVAVVLDETRLKLLIFALDYFCQRRQDSVDVIKVEELVAGLEL